jgi:cell division protein FtsB
MDMGDFHSYFIYILGVACSILGWFGRTLYYSVNQLKEDIKELSKELNEKYVRKDDYREDMSDIKNMLTKIFDKLDGKQDKR